MNRAITNCVSRKIPDQERSWLLLKRTSRTLKTPSRDWSVERENSLVEDREGINRGKCFELRPWKLNIQRYARFILEMKMIFETQMETISINKQSQ